MPICTREVARFLSLKQVHAGMNRNFLTNKTQLVILLALLFTIASTTFSYAAHGSTGHKSLYVTLINDAAAFFIFFLGMRIIHLTRGGFLSIAFILIISGLMVGWVVKIGFEFLTNAAILTFPFDVVSLAEALGGTILVIGFGLLSKKLNSRMYYIKSNETDKQQIFKKVLGNIIDKESNLYGQVLIGKIAASGRIDIAPSGEIIAFIGEPQLAVESVLRILKEISGNVSFASAIAALQFYARKYPEIKADLDEAIAKVS